MLLPLLLSFALAGADDPPVKVSLNNDNYFEPGDKARVEVKLAEDGYLLVLRADAQGRVRVLYPLDPSDDNFVRGRRTIEVRGRGDREAFFIDDKDGSGVVLAARSVAPFQFDEFVRGDHWDYRVLDTRGSGDDKETALLDMVQRMSPDAHFDYDVVAYVVSSRPHDAYHTHVAVGVGWGWGYPYPYGVGVGFGWGYPYYYSACDPFFYSCYSPFYYSPYAYTSYGYPYPYRYYGYPYRGNYYGGGYGYGYRPRNTFINRTGTGIAVQTTFRNRSNAGTGIGVQTTFRDRSNPTAGGIGPNFRVPDGALIARRRSTTVPVRDAMQRDRGTSADRDAWVGRRSAGGGGGVEGSRSGSGGGGGGDRSADRPSERRGGGGSGWSAPRGSSGGGDRGARAAPSNRSGGGGGHSGGGGGGGGGGGRRRP